MTEKQFNEFVKTKFEEWIKDAYIQALDETCIEENLWDTDWCEDFEQMLTEQFTTSVKLPKPYGDVPYDPSDYFTYKVDINVTATPIATIPLPND